jgi:hypothetical protein
VRRSAAGDLALLQAAALRAARRRREPHAGSVAKTIGALWRAVARRAAARGALSQLLCTQDSQHITRRTHMLAFQLPTACVTESAVPPSVLQRAVAVLVARGARS